MNLTDALAELAAQNRSMLPEDIREIMEHAGIDLMNSGIGNRALNIGDPIASFVYPM
jgi:hypothetical protein